MDRRRLVEISAGTVDQQRSGGSGYLVGQRLVLTCRHVVLDDQGEPWPRLEVQLGSPGDGLRRRVAARVAWAHPDYASDAALLRIEGEPFTAVAPVRWGWIAGTDPVPYSGLGYPEFADYESSQGVEQLGGLLPPLSVGADGGFVLDQRSAPEVAAGRTWRGVSGAAVFCRGLLTAMVTKDDSAFGNRRLHAIPVATLTAEPEFTSLITEGTEAAPALEAVEFVDFLQSPVNRVLAHTPGSLLAAAMEVVEFTGRDRELAELAAWRDGREALSVMLIAGEGGQGKTRLARQFTAQARRAGWVAGFLTPAPANPLGGDRGQSRVIPPLARQVQETTHPVLLVADYAETRPTEIAVLADILAGSPPAHPVRLLLLSRSAGVWWDNLTETLDPYPTSRINLKPLTEAGHTRQSAYVAAVTRLARRLAVLPESATERPPRRPWIVLAEDLAAHPPALDNSRLGNALTLQITALTDLLAAAAGQPPVGAFGERELVRHERGYLRRVAAKRGLFNPGILSDRADEDERTAHVWRALERALAGAILLGPCDANQALAIGALASHTRSDEVANWLAALYPSLDGGSGLDTVQPDRLAELILGRILIQQPNLLAEAEVLAEAADGGYATLATLMRTAAHPDFSQVGEQAADLIVGRPVPFAVAAPVLAAFLPQTGPLQDGLIRLGKRDVQSFHRTVYEVLFQLPATSVRQAAFSAALITAISDILHPLAEANPEVYRSELAALLIDMGGKLTIAGQREAAVAPATEAVEICRQLAAVDPGGLDGLAAALANQGTILAEVGQPQAALAPAIESVEIFRQLADANPEASLSDFATALDGLGNRLAEAGQHQAALAAAQESVTIRRQLTPTNSEASLSMLANQLNNLGNRLAKAGQHRAALAAAQESVTIRRQLTGANPDAHLPDFATALDGLGNRLAEAGQHRAALAAAQESVTIRRQLTGANPDAHLPELAATLNNLGGKLIRAGQRQAALAAAQESVTIRRQLIDANPDAHLPYLAAALTNLSGYLKEGGHDEAALTSAQEAVDTYRQLTVGNPDFYRPYLAGALTNLGSRLFEVGQHQAALTSAQEAVDTYRQATTANPDAHLPELAMSLHNLSIRLAKAGQHQAALAAAQESVDTFRHAAATNPDANLAYLAEGLDHLSTQLAKAGQHQAALAAAQESVDSFRHLTDPDTNLPERASSLRNLSAQHAEAGQRQAALAAAQESVDIYQSLAVANPDTYLPKLCKSLEDLSMRLTETSRAAEVSQIWVSAMTALPDASSQLVLTVALASFLLSLPNARPGVELLAKVLMTPGIPRPVEEKARRQLREHWRQHPRETESAWRSVSTAPVPDWIHPTDDDPETLTSRSNLAQVYLAEGRLDEAIPLFERILADSEQALGITHPDTLTSRSDVAKAYLAAGRLDEAIPLFEHILADSERVRGTHPSTLAFRDDLARAYEDAGRLDEAIPLFERTLADSEQALGIAHPDTLTSRNDVAKAYLAAGRLDEAIPLFERTRADSEQALGVTHPSTLAFRDNLARAYEDAGRLDEAIPLFERTLADSEQALGGTHPDTLTSRNHVAHAYGAAGRLNEAIPLLERTLTDSERILGTTHPDTLACRYYLAQVYMAAGRLDEAIPLFERTLTDAERVLGGTHLNTLSCRYNLAQAYLAAGRLDEAIPLFERTLTDAERVLGGTHPTTQAFRNSLTQAYQAVIRRTDL